MENPERAKIPSFKDFLPAFLILLAAGGGGLAVLLNLTLPTLGPRWLFFFFLVLLGAALALPAAYFLNLRFPTTPPAESAVILREALWAGIFISLMAWLRMGRVLTFPLGVLIAAGFVLIEVLLRLWDRSRWKPDNPES
ncbi:MAG TPA: hypothetical protein PKL82_01775 [Anaerolineaceae bacterium]|jgi:hypothetical protein|nr:hypothetical protein [Anaerolineaceae bacterium]NMD27912.1 hypothetical protein [Chloroflexota bacterium]HOA21200.1 hypothetical protein [Anaerolineaceae bacterium]HOG76908.1 hypothetical protein [Anaerolineaceae bacterium]